MSAAYINIRGMIKLTKNKNFLQIFGMSKLVFELLLST